MKKWNELSMAERAKYIQLGVINGVTSLSSIKGTYNRLDDGGFLDWKKKIAEYKGIIVDGDNEYNYEGFYYDNPDYAWSMLGKDPKAHFTDKYKTAFHPTFSNESIYSGRKSKFNPRGIIGGRWDNNNFILSEDQLSGNTDKIIDYLEEYDPGYTALAPDGSVLLRSVEVSPQSSALYRSREATEPNSNFMGAQDMEWYKRLGSTYIPKVPYTDKILNPKTCINTVTGFYDKNNTVANNSHLIDNPEKYGYREITQEELVPGDLIILNDGEQYPHHAVMFDSIAEEDGITSDNYPIIKGDTLVNYSNGGRGKGNYRLQQPIRKFSDPEVAGGDFTGKHRFFRYTGKKVQ